MEIPGQRKNLEKLVQDWLQTAIAGDSQKKAYYTDKFKELLEYQADPRFEVRPFEKEDGHWDYSLRIRGEQYDTNRTFRT